jgi:aldose 1-epimerase
VRREEHGLASHGLVHAWPWRVIEHDGARLTAELEYTAAELLAGFPFPHTLRAEITLHDARLAYTTTLIARDEPVPVAFGYHPYFAPPAAPRAQWHLELPAAERVVTDDRLLPTGEREPFPGFTGPLGQRVFDDGFAALPDGTTYAVTASDRRIAVTLEHGYGFAQVFAPAEFDVVCLEPMTAPANALASGEFAVAEPGRPYTARFTIEVG